MTEEEKEKAKEAKKATRREQLRRSQARFRQKQRNLKLQKQQHLEQDLQQLQEEIQGLKLKRQSLRFRGKSKSSPWSIVSEVFHLLETCFQSPWCVANADEMKSNIDTRRSLAVLQTTLALGVAMGELHGFDSLTEQLRRYALYFGDPHLQLKRIEAVAPGVVRATATLSVTITEFTLQCLFPHLESPKSDEEKDENWALREKILNQRLGCNSSMTFLFDQESGFVERLETSVDLLASLRGRTAVPDHSWSVFGPKVKLLSVHPVEKLRVMKFPHLNLVQTHVHPSKLQTQLMRWGTVLGVVSATYQFLTNLHTVPITGRTQVVVLSREEECELGNKTAQEELSGAKTIDDGPQLQLCLDVATRLVSVSEHLFPREYEWCIWLVDNPSSANACCAPGGKIIVQTGILDLIDFAVQKGICHRMESPLLKYIFQFAFNLPFSRTQEAEADHIGIMLLASACYDPSEAPRLWKAFTAFYADPEAGEDAPDLDFDWVSTHPSNRKRERALDGLVEAALEVQRRSSWCAFLQQKVLECVGANTEAELLHHIRAAMTQAQAEEARANSDEVLQPRRRNTVGTIHALESQEMLKVIQEELAAVKEQQEERVAISKS
ncbi:hypothetical protein BBO99_00008770 [Phytophthora kernoviae]|uniref:Peptidase M48 domain-containing protein n=2 Tax=Phytophthora kernoviae TaxID=325452 RepID=A0A3R7J311_9STRA|nr:hypothetical protein G195_010305 [Phytophthora kernoviae 00238/432]KAG2508766.1 hypothetical protein JM16_008725 [Phytophthora kernoviae]KAG2510843.1 hypothetical protein JM18_008797 [Phytophthora kernoviae]RLN36928.1 hypothetical protein BBI17_008941 [Phytophthora kernoviae]RLN74732.1 hypothetical protein BBO99_00008770 [Phytophthora kernoviae]